MTSKVSTSVLKVCLLSLCLSITNCKKDKDTEDTPTPSQPQEEKMPSADFNFQKSGYRSGDTIKLINTSSDADTYRWTMPDGQTNKSINPFFVTQELSVNQTLAFTLEAFSKSGNKTDHAVKTITVAPGEGQITLYTQNVSFSMGSLVKIDGQTMGPGSFSNHSVPSGCGASGYSTYTLTVGSHTIVADGGTSVLTQTVVVKANTCIVVQMDK